METNHGFMGGRVGLHRGWRICSYLFLSLNVSARALLSPSAGLCIATTTNPPWIRRNWKTFFSVCQ